jgi:hypothetical protein
MSMDYLEPMLLNVLLDASLWVADNDWICVAVSVLTLLTKILWWGFRDFGQSYQSNNDLKEWECKYYFVSHAG